MSFGASLKLINLIAKRFKKGKSLHLVVRK